MSHLDYDKSPDNPGLRSADGSIRRNIRPIVRSRGLSLLELMLVIAILVLSLSVAIPAYTGQVEKAKVARAIAEIGEIALEIDRFDLKNRTVPLTLVAVGAGNRHDPLGNPYQYLSLQNCDGDKCTNPNNETVKARRDGNLKPINSYFDLYSKGKDGESRQSLTANESQDDVVWAIDGAFVGLASDYSPK